MEAMMKVPCAPPCPPGPTSLPLSAPPKPSATQDFQDLIELSPDSGNGEDLDEFDPLKSPVKVADVKCEGEGPNSGATEADTLLPTPAGAGDHREFCSAESYGLSDKEKSDKQTKLASVYYNGLLADANVDVTGKPGLFNLNIDKDRWANTTPEMQITSQSDSGSSEEPPAQDSQYSTVFNFGPLESSLLESCNPSFQCGPFSTSCGPVSRLGRCYETNGPFSLPAGGDPVLDAGTYNAPYLLGADGSTTIRPFSMAPGTDNVRGYHGSVRAIVPLVQPPSRPTRNPSYPRCLRGRPTRRYTSHEVVRKQPTAGRLLTTSCDLMTSPPGQCSCVNPGNSHACAIRASGNSPLGVLNPLFEPVTSSTQVTNTSMPLSPRKFSLDQELASRGLQRQEFTRAPVPRKSLSACYQEPLNITSSLPCNNRGVFSRSCGSTQFLPVATSCSEYLPSQCQCHDYQKKPSVITAPDHRTENGDILSKDAHLDMECKAKLQNLRSSQNYVKPPLVTSPDWFSFLTPPQNSYTQRLFTPDDLQEELLYPAPYGLKSEIYQNLNAREADFVLQKPNRKPRTEPLPPSCLPVTSVPRPESPEATEGIISPLATEDEEAQIEGALESRKVSLKDRRKPSLEKIYIPKPAETTDSVLDVKIDNFDRDEYVKFKKTFGETDPEIESCLEATKKGSCSSISSQSAIKTPDPHVIKASAINGREQTEKTTPCLSSHPKKETSNTNNPDAKVPDDSQQGRQRSSTFTREVPTTSQSGDSHLNGMRKQASLRPCGKYSDVPLLKEMRSGNTRSRVPAMPKQRSLEEVEQRTAYTDKVARKQSLPTEELFGLRRPRSTRKMSLSPLIDCHFHNSHVCGSAAFSPVCEVDEISSKYIKDSSKRKTTGKMHMSDADSKKKVMHNHRDVGHKGNVKDKKNHMKDAKPSFSSSSRSSAKVEENSGSHHHRRPPEGTEHKHRTRSSTAGEGEARHKSGAQRSPRKARRHVAESHTNRRAPLSPPGPHTTADLFTKHEYSPEDRLTVQRGPTVPYEPLVDVITPTTPDTPMAASGATRKKQHSRSQSQPHHHHHRSYHHHHHHEDDRNVLSLSSISSSLSKSSSSSSSSTLTSPGSSRKGSSSSSSSSSSSGSDSSSSSSSSESSSSSSSSSDSSDFEDMIL